MKAKTQKGCERKRAKDVRLLEFLSSLLGCSGICVPFRKGTWKFQSPMSLPRQPFEDAEELVQRTGCEEALTPAIWCDSETQAPHQIHSTSGALMFEFRYASSMQQYAAINRGWGLRVRGNMAQTLFIEIYWAWGQGTPPLPYNVVLFVGAQLMGAHHCPPTRSWLGSSATGLGHPGPNWPGERLARRCQEHPWAGSHRDGAFLRSCDDAGHLE